MVRSSWPSALPTPRNHHHDLLTSSLRRGLVGPARCAGHCHSVSERGNVRPATSTQRVTEPMTDTVDARAATVQRVQDVRRPARAHRRLAHHRGGSRSTPSSAPTAAASRRSSRRSPATTIPTRAPSPRSPASPSTSARRPPPAAPGCASCTRTSGSSTRSTSPTTSASRAGGPGVGKLDRRAERRRARAAIERLGFDIDPAAMVSTLAASERTAVAVARALADTDTGVPLLVLDEPTASLPGPEVDRLFAALRRVAASGTSILFISHHLDEVLGLCDRVTVLRDGRLIATVHAGELSHDSLVELMLGRQLVASTPAHERAGARTPDRPAVRHPRPARRHGARPRPRRGRRRGARRRRAHRLGPRGGRRPARRAAPPRRHGRRRRRRSCRPATPVRRSTPACAASRPNGRRRRCSPARRCART